jgi:DNA-directed RNA polymerase specialized sigma24 family protein
MTAETLYQHCGGMVRERAWSFSQTTGLPYRDLLSEGNLVFCQAIQSFDPSRASFGTWLYRRLNQGLAGYSRKARSEPPLVELKEDHLVSRRWTDSVDFRVDLTKTSKPIRHVVEMLYDQDVAKKLRLTARQANQPKLVRGAIYRKLRREGWSWPTIWRTFNQVKALAYNI